MSKDSEIGLRDLFIALITATTTLAGSYFVFSADSKKADADLVATLYQQVQVMQEKMFEQQSQIVSLKIQLSEKYDNGQAIKDFLDASPHPSWIKIAEGSTTSPRFTSWHINKKYESFFGVKNEFYLGKSDNQVWPDETARQFYLNDLRVYRRLAPRCEKEHFPDKAFEGSETLVGLVCKWPIRVEGKTAIAGQVWLPEFDEIQTNSK